MNPSSIGNAFTLTHPSIQNGSEGDDRITASVKKLFEDKVNQMLGIEKIICYIEEKDFVDLSPLKKKFHKFNAINHLDLASFRSDFISLEMSILKITENLHEKHLAHLEKLSKASVRITRLSRIYKNAASSGDLPGTNEEKTQNLVSHAIELAEFEHFDKAIEVLGKMPTEIEKDKALGEVALALMHPALKKAHQGFEIADKICNLLIQCWTFSAGALILSESLFIDEIFEIADAISKELWKNHVLTIVGINRANAGHMVDALRALAKISSQRQKDHALKAIKSTLKGPHQAEEFFKAVDAISDLTLKAECLNLWEELLAIS